jgi:hypothetical protein
LEEVVAFDGLRRLRREVLAKAAEEEERSMILRTRGGSDGRS